MVPAYRKRAWDGPALGYFAHVIPPVGVLIDQFSRDRFILAVFHRLNATEPDNRLLLLGYFLKTRHFAGGRLV